MLVDTDVIIRVDKRNKKHYEDKGYDVSSLKIVVSSLDLQENSHYKIIRKCDRCSNLKEIHRSKLRDICFDCSNIVKGEKVRASDKYISDRTCECGKPKTNVSKVCTSCKGKYQTGAKHYNWKGGVGRGVQHQQWSRLVRAEYNNTCDCCKYDREIALEAHHYSFKEGSSKKDYSLDNGVALCANCHKEFHKAYGYGNNNYEQYLEFKRSF